MSTVQTVLEVNQLKDPHQGGDLHVYEFAVLVDGTYNTGATPSFDILAALQAQNEGVTAVAVKSVTTFQDYNDGTNVYTADNLEISLSSTGNKVVTFKLDSGATDGGVGTELSGSTALHGTISFVVVLGITGA